MSNGRQAFFSGLIDYAGLYPPVSASLDECMRVYFRRAAAPGGWILGRFVIPASRLHELEPLVPEGRLEVALILGGGDDPESCRRDLPVELTRALNVRESTAGRIEVGAVECRIPPHHLDGSAARAQFIADMAGSTLAALPGVRLWFEAPAGPDIRVRILQLIHALGERRRAGEPVGLKLRTGGLQEDSFPGVATVAPALRTLVEEQVPFKAAAGLHHPVRLMSAEFGVWMHGFVNLFGAALLLKAGVIAASELLPILEETDASHFSFDDGGFSWNGRSLAAGELAELRASFATSLASCDLDEPCGDLERLGWV